MRVEVSRQILEENVMFTIEDIIKSKNIDTNKVFENVVNKLYSKNIMTAELILSGSMTLDVLKIEELYHVTKALHEEAGREKLNPERYFTDIEIKGLNKYKNELVGKIDVVRFEDFSQVRYQNDQWRGDMDIRDVAKLVNANRVNYNFATQREPIIKESKNKETIIMKPKTYESSVEGVQEALEDNTYIPDTITFNILKNGEEEFEYKDRTLTVYKGEINALDGWHRIRAIIRTVDRYPNIERAIEVRVTNFDENKANRFLYQINKQNKIDERHEKNINTTRYENNIVRKINEESDFKGKIATDYSAIKQGRAVVGFEVLSESIRCLFDVENAREERLVGEYLVKFFNELYGIFYNEFKDVSESKQQNTKLQPSSFVGYISIAKELYNTNNWESNLEEVLTRIDFSKDNEKLAENKRLSEKYILDIASYFKKFI